ncbi:carbohydrate-binding module family 35 protein [Karstenula rhodostoma CBS 690.94]|uniref:Alpha-galactosidase n=1 Tax=Karstenula rhodostoma CBS 690.94 TaxID=1392251 RepID=A0A9P4PLA2_9PLEO|nr:carbohydrate-binding module family 35 protein [Karstenula rhodostoma CBS 690.94]
MYPVSLLLLGLISSASAKSVKSPTPPMGWNTYNAYNCNPSEQKVKLNAQGLVDLGLNKLGYNIVTPDCGWNAQSRDSSNKLQWNTTLFPSGGKALGDYLHGLGLKFGLYSGAGYLQCGSAVIPGSLGYEDIDARSFSSWGGDSLKYDNCYATSKTTMVDSDSAEAKSPARFQKMETSLEAVDRPFQYFICQWGIGENVGEWASKIGNTWRMSNDIYNAWRSIWRITNQVVPYWRNTRPGAFPDMDMLLVGLNVLSAEEERFHFGMWAINKSPLMLGGILDSKLSKTSLAIMSNKEVIAINQDSLAKQAQLVRRYTVEEWDIWLGELSGSRKVIGIANWRNQSQTVSVDLASLGIASATVRDVWAAKNVGTLSGTQNVKLAAHELKLWVLTNITTASTLSSTYYEAASAKLAGGSSVTTCSYGDCLPAGKKVGNIGSGFTVTFNSVTAKSTKAVVGVDFINYDYAFTTAWDWGSNTRNMTIAVNGGSAKRWAFPLSGEDWYQTGRLNVEIDGLKVGSGSNSIVFANVGTVWAPDLVGIEVFG